MEVSSSTCPTTSPLADQMNHRYISPKSARALISYGQEFLPTVPAPQLGRWRECTDGQLWTAVLCQIAVAGGADGGDRLKANLNDWADEWYSRLLRGGKTRAASVHAEFVKAGVRFVSKNEPAGRKTLAALANFKTLVDAGGPRAFFSEIDQMDEPGRIRYIRTHLRYVKHKGSRDLLIGLGAVESAIALDVRWKNILERVGVQVPKNFQTSQETYEQLEQELLQHVCGPLGATGAHLDRAFFAEENYLKVVGKEARISKAGFKGSLPCVPGV